MGPSVEAVARPLELPEAAARPTARANATLVVDPLSGQLLLFGGLSETGYLNDLWALQLGDASPRWEPVSGPGAEPVPGPRRGHSAFFDPVSARMVVAFGQGGGFFNDVWAYDPGTARWEAWTPGPERAESAPSPRYGSVLVHDAQERRGVGFAGFTSTGRFDDAPAFELEARAWQELTDPASPRPQRRCLHTGVYDPQGHRLVIFGGQRAGALDDTWALALETGNWQELIPAEAEWPRARFFAVSAYDPIGNRALLVGGRGTTVFSDLWALELTPGKESWRPLGVEGMLPARHSAAGAFLPEAHRLLLFGGKDPEGRFHNDLWEVRL